MNVSHLNIYTATIPDRMHHLDLGLFNYQVTYTRELLKEWCGQIAVDELDNRLARIPRFPVMFRAKLICDRRNVSPFLGFGFGYSEIGEIRLNLPILAKSAHISEISVTCRNLI